MICECGRPKDKRAKWCPGCRVQRKRTRQLKRYHSRTLRQSFSCAHCGTQFIPKCANRKTFCSRDCSYAAQRAAATLRASLPKAPKPPKLVPCLTCGVEFEQVRRARFCGEECRKEMARRKSRNRSIEVSKASRRVICASCEQPFEREYGNDIPRKTCSDVCYARQLGMQQRRHKDTRRARRRNAFVAPVYRREIYERDGWTCQLCGDEVDRTAAVPDPLSATLDHIVPLAKGGTHEPSNVQLAHFLCNSVKGDRLAS